MKLKRASWRGGGEARTKNSSLEKHNRVSEGDYHTTHFEKRPSWCMYVLVNLIATRESCEIRRKNAVKSNLRPQNVHVC